MALTTSMPVIGDLTMKFSTHSIHDQFQLPASFYQCFEQAKDLALYLQPNVFFVASPKSGQGTLFEFEGSGGSSESHRRRHREQERDSSETRDCEEEAARPRSEYRKKTTTKARELRANKQVTHAGRTNAASDASEKGFGEGSIRGEAPIDNRSSSEDEELTGYFSGGEDRASKQDTSSGLANREPTSTERRHGRKRSMEHEECPTIKRCCRPRLNFEKMQLNREVEDRGFASSEEECHANYFRPISPQDLT